MEKYNTAHVFQASGLWFNYFWMCEGSWLNFLTICLSDPFRYLPFRFHSHLTFRKANRVTEAIHFKLWHLWPENGASLPEDAFCAKWERVLTCSLLSFNLEIRAGILISKQYALHYFCEHIYIYIYTYIYTYIRHFMLYNSYPFEKENNMT